MGNTSATTFLGRLTDQIHPTNLSHDEHRLELRSQIEHLMGETGVDRAHLGNAIRREIHVLRAWLSQARNLSTDSLTEICGMLHISIGELVAE